MKFIIEREALNQALSTVRSASKRSNLPILSHVAISTFDKSVEFICTDLDMTLRVKVPAEVQRKGETTVRSNILHDLIKSFPGEHVQLELEKNELVTVTSAKSKYQLGTLDFKEFPPMPKLKDAVEFDMPQHILRGLLARTSFSISKDESRYVLCSSLLRINGEETTAVATDGRRLTMDSNEATTRLKKERDVLLPTSAVGELLHLLSSDEDNTTPVTIALTQNQAQFYIGDTHLVTKLIEGNYPNYQQVIPDVKKKDGVLVNRAELLSLIERCSLISDCVALTIRKRSLTVESSNRKELIGDAYETMMLAEGLEKPVRIKCNSQFLIEPLRTVTTDDVLLFVTDSVSPLLLKTEKDPWLSVVMPMRDEEVKVEQPTQEPQSKPAAPVPEEVAA